jgi:hypothetical protein
MFRAVRFILILSLVVGSVAPALAQRRFEKLREMLGGNNQAEDGGVAAAGEPFGVGKIVLTTPAEAGPADAATMLALSEATGRVSFPAYVTPAEKPVLRELLKTPQKLEVLFLVTGKEPLKLSVQGAATWNGEVQLANNPQQHQKLLGEWWQTYTASTKQDRGTEFPPLVENYVAHQLAGLLHLPLPPAGNGAVGFKHSMELLAGTERSRLAVEQHLLQHGVSAAPANVPLPTVQTPQVAILEDASLKATPVEVIASHVPAECFYVRYGSFANFQWFRHRMDQWGGDARNLVIQRSLDFGESKRVENQLGVHETTLGKIMGGAVIEDVAFLGMDTFLRDGPAVGSLFHAKNNLLLGSDLQRQRRAQMASVKGAREETINVGKKSINAITSPDNKLRSFYAVDGDFHLVTTSRRLAERFLEAADNHTSLADLPEFRHARSIAPVGKEDILFAYFSRPFLENLLAPHYQVEVGRRSQSLALRDLARLDEWWQTRQPGFAPPPRGPLVDGSHWEVRDGEWLDTLRGARGTFLPVPDVRLEQITAEEAAAASEVQSTFRKEWGGLDPILAIVRRGQSDLAEHERISIDAYATPLEKKHFDLAAKWLGPASAQRLSPVPGNVIEAQIGLRGGTMLANGGDYFLFGALRDAAPVAPQGLSLAQLLNQFAGLEGVQGYLGAWPNPGLLSFFGSIVQSQADANGFSHLLSGIWRRQWQNFTLLSLHPEVLAEASGQLHFEESDHPAQIWLRADDVLSSHVAPLVNQLAQKYVVSIDRGNVRLMKQMNEQLGLPAPMCQAAAEDLLGAKLLAPMGGEYQCLPQADGTAGLPVGPAMQGSYELPALRWLRRVRAEALLQENHLFVHFDLDMPDDVKTPIETAKPMTELPPPVAKPVQPVPQTPRPALKEY